MLINRYTYFTLCLGLSLAFFANAGGRAGLVPITERFKQTSDAEPTPDVGSDKSALYKTLNLNFSPERREELRRALEAYARAVDPSHEQIEERRRQMQDSIEKRFFEADANNDGTLDRQEATDRLPQIARHFSSVDTNQDGVISLTELVDVQSRIAERRRAAEAALELERQNKLLETEEVAETIKDKSKQATNASKKKSL
ncbi:MAG: EF-hand domain-containing protein [Methylotenera sp.]|jgi:Ca2+-binding EF-hand superfamily protein|nr:EF-hand domain-containing protein [Methylotenera sp.]